MFAIWYLPRFGNLFIQSAANVHVRISFYRNRKPFYVNPSVIIEKLFPNGEKIVDS